MIEIYLFVNPLGPICLDAEMKLLEYMGTTDKKIQVRVMPLVNIHTINNILERKGIEKTAIAERNQLSEQIYSAALDAKAVQLQGKKRGRAFLMALQKAVGCDGETYDRHLVERLVSETGADLEMFQEDRESEFVKELFLSDQVIAREMGIKKHPSAVVYNYSCDRDYGVLLDGAEALRDIPRLCQTDEENYQIFHLNGYLQEKNERRVRHASQHLKLM